VPESCNYLDEPAIIEGETKRGGCTAIVLDLLVYPQDYLQRIKALGLKVLSFHEREVEDSYSDIVVNCNSFKGFDSLRGRNGSRGCYGPRYVILREAIRNQRPMAPKVEVENVLISMGGSDPGGATLKVLRALSRISSPPNIIVHLGPAFKYLKIFAELYQSSTGRIAVKENVPELADLMITADMAIASAGNTMYELCYLGIPSLIVAQNGHQLEFATELDRVGAAKSLGLVPSVDEDQILDAFVSLRNNYQLRDSLSRVGRKLIDGKGVERLKEELRIIMGVDGELDWN
jgi:spore coat polysaccharide biosynthesis predicted glycosyltransferase SpsG